MIRIPAAGCGGAIENRQWKTPRPQSTGFEPNGNLVEPIWEDHHDLGASITGGHIYRGRRVPELPCACLHADYVAGQVRALWYDAPAGRMTANRTIRGDGPPEVAVLEDDLGEV